MSDVEEKPLFGLSRAQRGMWFLCQSSSEANLAYSEPFAFSVRGQLEVHALEEAVSKLVERHEALRAYYPSVEGQPELRIGAERFRLQVCDASHVPAARAAEVVEGELHQPIDPTRAPLVRVVLYVHGPSEHTLLLMVHHLAIDGVSALMLAGELVANYVAAAGRGPALAPRPVTSLADIAGMLEADEADPGGAAHRLYYSDRLSGELPATTLPLDWRRPPLQSFRGAALTVRLAPAVAAALLQANARLRSTPFVVALAAFQAVLSQYNDQQDVLVASPVAGRTRPEQQDAIGMMVNLLPLRADVRGDATFSALVDQARKSLFDTLEHQAYPFPRLIEDLGVARRSDRPPLCLVTFRWEDLTPLPIVEGLAMRDGQPRVRGKVGDLEIESLGPLQRTVKFDLSLVLRRVGSDVVVWVQYDQALYAAPTIHAFAQRYVTFLEHALAAPQRSVRELWSTRATTRGYDEEVVALLDGPSIEYPSATPIHRVFEELALSSASARAVTRRGAALTYRELNERANKLARLLKGRGVRRGDRVATFLARTVDMPSCLLAVLKCGAAYVPLDASDPLERVAMQLELAQPTIVLGHSALLERVPTSAAQVVVVEEIEGELLRLDGSNLAVPVEGADLAYVMYTSGSTGHPKGVAVPHRAVVRLVKGQDYVWFDAGLVGLQMAPLSFDAATFELWAPLLNGGRLALYPEEAPTLDGIGRTIREEGVNTLWMTAGLFHLAVGQGLDQLRPLRVLIAGGDVLQPASVRKALAELPGVRLVNGYGPTESTTFAACHPIVAGRESESVSIGRPIANTNLYVLDSEMQALPVGVVGELYIGGDGVARGYLEEPRLTGERFLPDPYTRTAGARMYRTGDRVRLRSDGDLEFVGRVDQQVKLRGYRIELGEIEGALSSHWAVVAQAAKIWEHSEQKRLAAYVVLREGTAVSGAALTEHLASLLPSYMLPHDWVFLPELPLTPRGKVDRAALPQPSLTAQRAAPTTLAPRDAREALLASVWASELGRPQVGIDENFFTLGGDSIISLQVRAKLRAQGWTFEIRDLFENPTIAGLASRLSVLDVRESVAPQPLSLLSDADRQRVPAELCDAYPLAALQLGMLFHGDLARGMYHDVFCHRVEAVLEPAAFRVAVECAVTRHPMLRTWFALDGYSEPLQLVAASATVRIDELASEQAVDEWVQAELARGFDLERAPLLAFAVCPSASTFLLCSSFHHAILDGWSFASLMAEMLSDYRSLLERGTPHQRRAVSSTYREFVALEREAAADEACKQFFRSYLEGAEAATLPEPIEGSAETTTSYLHHFEPRIVEAVSRLAARAGSPLKSVCLAAHLYVMQLLSGRDDVLTGVVTHGRLETLDGQRVLGLFLNTLPFRIRTGAHNAMELVRAVAALELELSAYRRYPFAKCVREAGCPELTTCFNFVHFHVADREHTIAARLVRAVERTSFALLASFIVEPESRTLSLELMIDPDRLSSAQAQKIAGYYSEALIALGEDRGAFARRGLLPVGELQWIVGVLGRADEGPRSGEKTLVGLLARQERATPHAPAVRCQGRAMTYRELHLAANRLAHRLRGIGVGAESTVAVALPRTEQLLVSVLAILKAGAAYVPLDLRYPQERVEMMLEDSGARVVLVSHDSARALPAVAGQVVSVDQALAGDLEAFAAPDVSLHPESLAYLIYTSGSTGRPKATAIEHRNAVRFIEWALAVFAPDELTGVAFTTSLTFDLSVFELFAPLSCGGTVICAEDALALPTLVDREHVRTVNTVPSAMAELVRLGGVPPNARCINLAGEALPASLAAEIHALPQVHRLLNLYGPSEDTTYSTYTVVAPGDPRPPCIGRPVWSTRVYVLDSRSWPVPPGVAGEICLAGEGLARGYLGRSALTAERFVPEPFSGKPGERMYRTGDLGRFRADGVLEYLGRVDHQVKIRGHRVELGEIESVLRRLPQVRECVLTAQRTGLLDLRLIAYVAIPGLDGAARVVRAAELRRDLAQSLPAVMVPSHIEIVEFLPRTPNGKVDRGRLTAVAPEVPLDLTKASEARSPIEAVVAEIWRELLGCENVWPESDFFELGGHSLIATRVIAKVRQLFEVELSVGAILEARTVAGLAHRIELKRQVQAVVLPSIQPQAQTRARASFAQERLWFLHRFDDGNAAYNMCVAVHLQGSLEERTLAGAIGSLVERHAALRTVFVEGDGNEVYQVIHPEPRTGLDVVDLSTAADGREAARQWVEGQAQHRFDLSTGPLFRPALLRIGSFEWVLCLTMHHIISDGWSMGILTRELGELYRAAARGEVANLPRLDITYADYSAWQRDWLMSGAIKQQLRFWKDRLGDAAGVLALPTDHPRPARQTYGGTMATFTLPRAISKGVLELGRREGGTLFMTLMAGFLALLGRYTSTESVSIGVPIANRRSAQIERLIGFFVNTLVMRNDLAPETFHELLVQVRREALAAFDHQDLPFEQLVAELVPERDLSHSPVFQVMFVMQNAANWSSSHNPLVHLELDGVTVTSAQPTATTSKYDLTLGASEVDGDVAITFEWNTSLFERSTIERMARHYQYLLQAMVENPRARWRSVPLLSEQERAQALSVSAPALWREEVATIHEWVARQAAESPRNVAVIDGEVRWDYEELMRRAGEVANELRARGIGPEDLIGVCLPRTATLVATLLGVLSSGGAYLALDPRYPRERLETMIADAGARLVIVDESTIGRLPGGVATMSTSGLAGRSAQGRRDVAPAPGVLGARQLAYVLCTSGSTGRPKSIALEHAGALELLAWAKKTYSAQELQRVLFGTSICFDLSIFELFVPLVTGGAVVVAENVLHLATLPAAGEVTLINTVPSAAQELLRAGRLSPSVRCLNLAGEVLSEQLAGRVYEEPGVERLLNLYGPTEDTTYSTAELVPRSALPTIGRPISGTAAYVLDAELQPVPQGVVGELYLAGGGLARGYIGQSALTASRFLPCPFEGTGRRMYRTGDRARLLPDGRIEYLGRIDTQVKLRGFRIELAEVEHALEAIPGIKQAVVVMRGVAGEDQRLVGYVVLDDAAPSAETTSASAQGEALGLQQVDGWRAVWDGIYGSGSVNGDDDFDVTGWTSSYTGLPLPQEVMREWRDETVARLLELRPRRVLEIGCGTGLLALPMLRHVEHYHGRDLSSQVIAKLRRVAARHGDRLSLRVAEASDLTDVRPSVFDLVVMNSVVQYFPNGAYLLDTIEQAVSKVADGGHVFIGDVRNAALQRAFRVSIELARAPATLGVGELRQRVESSLHDEELLIDPEFFRCLPTLVPRVSAVRILLKSANNGSELSRFRYDVVLVVGRAAARPSDDSRVMRVRWSAEFANPAVLRRLLEDRAPQMLVVSEVPNARVAADMEASELLVHNTTIDQAGDVREVAAAASRAAMEPSDLARAGHGLPYIVDVSWSTRAVQMFDIAFQRTDDGTGWRSWQVALPVLGRADAIRLVTDPLRQRRWEASVPQIQAQLGANLPAYMVPSDLVCLEELPKNANGKVARDRLPDPKPRAARSTGRAPETPGEVEVHEIFAQVLGVSRVSTDEDFFAIGGHSLLAVQIVSRVRSRMGVALPLHSLFMFPTISALAAEVDRLASSVETFEL